MKAQWEELQTALEDRREALVDAGKYEYCLQAAAQRLQDVVPIGQVKHIGLLEVPDGVQWLIERIAALESELARVREQNHRLRNVLSGPGNAIVGYAQSATLLQGYANWSTALIEYADRLGEAIDRELAAEVEG